MVRACSAGHVSGLRNKARFISGLFCFYSDLYNMMVSFNHAAPLVALDAIKELQREYRNMSYAEKQEVLQNYFDLWMD